MADVLTKGYSIFFSCLLYFIGGGYGLFYESGKMLGRKT